MGETVTAAIEREVWEETGYRVRVMRLIGVYSDPHRFQIIRYPDGNLVHYISCCFECEIIGGEPALSDETLALQWCDVNVLPEPFVPAHHIRLQDVLAARPEAFIR